MNRTPSREKETEKETERDTHRERKTETERADLAEAAKVLRCEWILWEGAKEPEVKVRENTFEEMRMLEPSGMADLESSKRQLRAAVRKFWAFLKEGKMTFREKEAPVLVRWLQTMLRNNPKIKRISTLMQYARQIQSVLRVNVLQSARR